MSNEKITIDKKEVLELYKENKGNKENQSLLENLFGKEAFQEKITDRIKNFTDVLDEVGISEDDWEYRIEDLEDDEITYIQCKLIAEVFNEGWEADYADPDQWKYYVYLYFKDGGAASHGTNAGPAAVYSSYAPSNSFAYISSRLAFKSRALALHAGKLFLDIYKKFLTGL